jgi:hypothetical protein
MIKLPRIYKRSDSHYWWCTWLLPDGTRKNKYLHDLDLTYDISREDAEKILYKHLGIDEPEIIPTPDALTLAWFRDETNRRVVREGWRKNTIREYQIAFEHFINMLSPDLLITEVKKLHVSQFQDYLLEKGNAPLTVNKVCSELRAAFQGWLTMR